MVIDRRQLERDLARASVVLELTAHVLLDCVKALVFLIISAEVLLVHLVDQHFVRDARLDLVSSDDKLTEHGACRLVVLSLSIDHIHERSTVLN